MFVEVVSPEENCFSGDATMVISRTPNGEIGILEGHEQTVATLVPGGSVSYTHLTLPTSG